MTASVRPSAAAPANAFDLLRLVLALLVVYTHACFIGGFGAEGFQRLVRDQTGAGPLAVLGFFAISGFLVTQSFVVRGAWRPFVRARLLRILPGLWLSLVLTAFVLAPVIARLNPHAAGWHVPDAVNFVRRNALTRVGAWSVGDVLVGLPYADSLNGALWSLYPEILCYAGVLVLGLTGFLQQRRTNLAAGVAVIVVLHVAFTLQPDRDNLTPTLLRLTHWSPYLTSFAIGALGYVYRDLFGFGPGGAAWWGLVAAALLKFGGWALAGPIVFPLAILHLAHAFRARLPVDLSYGIYILHFPVLQLLAAAQLNRAGFPAFLAVGVFATSVLALVSWLAVEKPALLLKGTRHVPAADAPQRAVARR